MSELKQKILLALYEESKKNVKGIASLGRLVANPNGEAFMAIKELEQAGLIEIQLKNYNNLSKNQIKLTPSGSLKARNIFCFKSM